MRGQSSISESLATDEVRLRDTPTIPTTATIRSFAKKVRTLYDGELECLQLTSATVCVSSLLISEIKRIIKDSEIIKEDDSRWPQKNKDGRQELEIRLGSDHIQFEVCLREPDL
jgi:hypothetical protein